MYVFICIFLHLKAINDIKQYFLVRFSWYLTNFYICDMVLRESHLGTSHSWTTERLGDWLYFCKLYRYTCQDCLPSLYKRLYNFLSSRHVPPPITSPHTPIHTCTHTCTHTSIQLGNFCQPQLWSPPAAFQCSLLSSDPSRYTWVVTWRHRWQFAIAGACRFCDRREGGSQPPTPHPNSSSSPSVQIRCWTKRIYCFIYRLATLG